MSKEHKHETHYQNIKVTKLPHSEIEIIGEIDAKELEQARAKAIKSLGQEISIDGFRKGHVPEAVLAAKLGETAIMEEAAEIVLGHEYQHIIIDHKIDVIARPQITLTKLARGNPLGFKIRVAVFPEFDLPDYKKIAAGAITQSLKENEKMEVSEKELDDVVDDIRKSIAGQEKLKNVSGTEATGEKAAAIPQEKLPELTDEFVKKLGDFSSVADFKEKIRTNLKKEKESRAAEKKRIKISEELVSKTKIDLPEIVIESELNRMSAQFNADIERMGVKLEDYLKHIKKSEADMRADWRKDAEKRSAMQMIFNKIAMAEKLLPEEKEVDAETKHLLEHHKDADPERAKNYAETMLVNEKVFTFLEAQK